MFSAIHYPRLRNNEFVQFIKNLIEIINANNPEVLKVIAQCEDLAALLTVLSALSKTNLGSTITLELQDIDTRRDSDLVGIEMQIKSFTYHFDQAKQEAALVLTDSLADFGPGISRMNYQAETGTIESLIKKWENEPKLIRAITTLSLTDWVKEMKTANILFNNRYLDRIKEDADAPEIKTIELRKQIIQSYRTLLAHLEAHATLSSETVYSNTISQINLLIEQYNNLVAGRSKNKEEEEEILSQE